MSETPPNDDLRLVRILAPATLLREVDSLVRQRKGGYESRQEFFLDAVENHILEVKYGAPTASGQRQLLEDTASESPAESVTCEPEDLPANESEPPLPPALANGEPIGILTDFAQTELRSPARGAVVEGGLAVAEDLPLFGLHNRDYPSIWALHQLAEQTQDGFIPLKVFVDTALTRAWRFTASLVALDEQSSTKLTALFPKNKAKPQSAEASFKAFAIGALAKTETPDGHFRASGPFFAWDVAQVHRRGDALEIGPTEAGYELLDQLDGISLRLPHEEHFAVRFLEFLEVHAPEDAAGFQRLLDVVPEGLTRTELAESFKQWKPAWSETEANTHAAAYVARAREWGLLEEKLVDRCYALTEFGNGRRARASA